MLRIKGELLAAKPEPDLASAERHFALAIEQARRQGALGWELRAAMSIGRLWARQGRAREARTLLEPLLGRFSQGLQTSDLAEARRLLSELP